MPAFNVRDVCSGMSRNTFVVAAGSFFADMATEMLTPILPIFMTHVLGTSGSIVGLVDGIAQAVRNIVDGLFGPISDKLRSRRSIAVAGYALSAVAKPLMGISTVWEGVLAGRVMDRVGAGVVSAPREALISFSTDHHHLGRGFGLEGVGENAGSFSGPILTVLLFYAWELDFRTVFYLAFIPGLLALLALSLVRERHPSIRRQTNPIREATRLPAEYWRFLIVIAIFSIGNSSNAFLILQVQDVGGSVLLTTLVYAAFNLVAALVAYPAGYLADKWGKKALLFGTFMVALTVYSGLALTRVFAATIAIFVVYGLYEGTFRSSGRMIASELAPEELRASAIGWFSMTAGLCQLIANLIAGALWDSLGHAAAFTYGATASAAGLTALTFLLRSNGRARRKQSGQTRSTYVSSGRRDA
jgi:MFS family permease